MPFTGEIDPSEISKLLNNLGDQKHGLRPYGTSAPVPENPRGIAQEEREEIFRASYGDPDMSTAVGLKVVPKIIWDVNGYYRSLGFGWPYRPTKGQLRIAYQERGGPDDERLTYHFKQLLQPDIRAEYDAMPLGSRYDDKYVQLENKRKLSTIAKEESEESGKLVTVQDLMDEQEREHKERGDIPKLDPVKRYWWNWGYYTFKSRKYNPELLEVWQRLLVEEFSAQGLESVISIGYIGKTKKDVVLRQHEGKDIIFLNEDTEPTNELAKTAVSMYKAHRQKGTR